MVEEPKSNRLRCGLQTALLLCPAHPSEPRKLLWLAAAHGNSPKGRKDESRINTVLSVHPLQTHRAPAIARTPCCARGSKTRTSLPVAYPVTQMKGGAGKAKQGLTPPDLCSHMMTSRRQPEAVELGCCDRKMETPVQQE